MKTLVRATSLFLDSASPFVCNIFNGDRPSVLFAPEGDPAPGGGGDDPPSPGGDPAPGAPPKTFSQADMDRMIGQRLVEERKKFADYGDLQKQVAKLSEDSKKRQELEDQLARIQQDKELEGASAAERERISSDRARQALERERLEYTSKVAAEKDRADKAENSLREERISIALGTALDAAKVYGPARAHAVKLFREDCEVEFSEDGKVAAVTFGGVRQTKISEAAEHFLKENDYLASGGNPRSGGTRTQSGPGNGRDPKTASIEENFADGLSQPPKPVSAMTAFKL